MKTKFYPLSYSQQGIYFEWEKDRSLTQYSIAFLYDLDEKTDAERLKQAFTKVFEAHPGLKARLRQVGDEVVQYINDKEVPVISVTALKDAELQERIGGFIRPFDLLGGPLYRVEIFRTEKKTYALVDFHHIIFDGASLAIFNRDLARAYEGAALEKEHFTGCDFAAVERGRKGDPEYLAAMEYFGKRMNGVTMTKVPMLRQPVTRTGHMQLTSAFTGKAQVNDFCTHLGISPNNLFAGALGICLSRYSREKDVAFCTAHHGRLDERVRNSIGMFVKTLPVVMQVPPDQPVKEYLSALRGDMTELWGKQAYPFSEIVKTSGISMELNYTFQRGFTEYFDLDGTRVNCRFLRGVRTNDSLIIYIMEWPDQYEIRCEYNDSLYERAYMTALAEAIKNTVLNIIGGENLTCRDIAILSPEQEQAITAVAAGRPMKVDTSHTLVSLFRQQAALHPDAPAVTYANCQLSYCQLDQLTDRIATTLVASGVRRETVVGILIDRSEYMVIYPLAIMKAGGAYMPLDIAVPTDRLEFMIGDAGVSHILSEGDRVATALPGFSGFVMKREEIMEVGPAGGTALPEPAPGDMFVLLYTSGSTGTPKGCMLEHRNIVNFCQWYAEDFSVTPEDRGVAYANFAFDAHMMDIYPMLTAGASVYIIPAEMRLDLVRMNRYMEENGLTIAFMTTQIGRQFAEDIDNHSLRLLSVGGERLLPVKKPPYRFYNGYGPTECTIYSTVYNIEHDYDSSVIGRALANVSCYIMDKNQQLLPQGVPGELCIGGAGVGRGYLNRDDLNREKFVPWRGNRLYLSGDLARYNESGEIEYFGRLDNQVKLRGLRIELGEIENVMTGYAGISTAVVDVKEIGGVQHLCGYYMSKQEIGEAELRDHLRLHLLEYMVPTALIRMDDFPLTKNGKVNRALLPVPKVEIEESVPPATELEERLFEIVAELLKTRDFGVTTNLFSLGLTSIMAIKLSVAIQKKTGLAVQTKEILRHKTIRLIAGVAETLQPAPDAGQAPVFEKRDYYPLTENQLGLYYDWEKNREALQYNIGAALRFPAHIDTRKLRDAVVAVVEAHPYLKTTLAIRGNDIVQMRRDEVPVEIFVETNEEEKMTSVIQAFTRPFNLFGDTLFRFAIHQTEESVYLLFDFHHIIFDGLSMGLFLQELKEAFEGTPPAREQFTAFDRALEEQAIARSEKYVEAETWFDQLLGSVSMTVIPSYQKNESKGVSREIRIDIPAGGIGEFCRTHAVTESNFFLAALCLLISRYAREEQVAMTTVAAGRQDGHLTGTMGMFVKTLPVVAEIKKQSFLDLARTIQEQLFTSMERDIYPFTRMAEKYGIAPQINFTYEGGITTGMELGGEPAQVTFLDLDTVKFPISAVIFPHEGGYALTLEYDDQLYLQVYAQRFAEIFARSTAILVKDAGKPLSDICLVEGDERKKVLELSYGGHLKYERQHTFLGLFRKHVEETPESAAIVDKSGLLTYAGLDRLSDHLAGRLVASGVVPGDFVAVMLPREKEFMVSVLAIMKAGGAYVPMDQDYPNDRLVYMLENCCARVLITRRDVLEQKRKEGDFPVDRVLLLEESGLPADPGSPAIKSEHPLPPVTPAMAAYMIYTSGSTGKPKGVMIAHGSLTAMLAWYAMATASGRDDRISCYPSFSFDASVLDLFLPLAVGATSHIIPSEMRQNMMELYDYLVAHKITGGVFSTQFGMELLNQFDLPLRFTMLGGEKLLPVRKSNTIVLNGYGPTEFTVSSSFHIVDPDNDPDNIPIGKPVPNSWSYVVDANMQLLPQGMAGELCLSGIQIAKGYWKREDLTAEKFIVNPYSTCEENALMYRTGDLVRWNDQGELEFLGRIDTQVKLRGFRIELGEIESTMKRFPGVITAVADVKEFGGAQHLCGYFTAEKEISIQALLDHLRKGLTEYMVPTELMQLPALPLTPNGKVNRKALPLPEMARTVEYVPPQGEAETGICAIYAEILKLEKVGALDDFFAIGGSSMSAIKAIIRIINLGYALQYGDLFRLKTPRAVAAFVTTRDAPGEEEEKPQLEDISGYDYTAIDRILTTDKPDLWENYTDYRLGDVLLTGATGYLGIHVLRELIDRETGKIYCMVRSKGSLTAEKRLETLLMYYFSDGFDDLFGSQIIPVNGEITSKEALESLKGKGISTVINCAAMVKHFAAGDELDQVNVEGVAALAGFCTSEKARLVHVSTSSISGLVPKERRGSGIVLNESSLYVGQTIDNKYVMSKFKAERLLLQAASEGLDTKIMRVGNLMGRYSDGEFQVNFRSNAFINTLKSYKILGMFPLSQLVSRVEISPIDCVAGAVVALAHTPQGIRVAHPYNNYRLNMANVIYAMKQYGFEIDLVSDAVFNDHFREVMQDPRRSEYMSGLLHYRIGEGFVPVPDENDYTTTLLYRAGFRWPVPGDDYAIRLITVLDGMGFFDEN